MSGSRAAGFLALTVTGVDAAGVPRLAGTNRRVIATTRFGAEDVGRQAVCQPVADDEGSIVAFGILKGARDDTATTESPVEITCGEASLRLNPDGRITLQGSRLDISTDGPFRLRSARIDLN